MFHLKTEIFSSCHMPLRNPARVKRYWGQSPHGPKQSEQTSLFWWFRNVRSLLPVYQEGCPRLPNHQWWVWTLNLNCLSVPLSFISFMAHLYQAHCSLADFSVSNNPYWTSTCLFWPDFSPQGDNFRQVWLYTCFSKNQFRLEQWQKKTTTNN
jgi:hypothetical protein